MTEPGGAIVITGASTGIGQAAAEALARRGFVVYAGVRRDADAERLESLDEKVRGLILDVTRPESIAAAVERLEDELADTPLVGLLSNAGITISGPLEFLPLDELRRQFEVNLFGAVSVVQAFLPRLRRHHGRIVLTGSTSGFMTTPLLGAYCMSKHAMESMADALRMEVEPFGVAVSLIQPGSVETAIWDKGQQQTEVLLSSGPSEMAEIYGPLMEGVQGLVAEHRGSAVPAQEVAATVVDAFTARRPKERYLTGGNARIQRIVSHLPTRWQDRLLRRMLRRDR